MHISQLPNGRWRVIVQVDNKRHSKTVDTQREARKVGAQIQLELGEQPDVTVATVGELIEQHLELVADRVADTTLENYRGIQRKIPDWLNAWRIDQVTTRKVEMAYRTLLDEGWSAHRVRTLHGMWRPAFSTAVRWDWLASNPVTEAHQPSEPYKELVPVSPQDVVKIIMAAVAVNPELATALHVAAATGMRRGEVIGLKWADINLDNGTLTVRRSITTTTTDAHGVRPTKTGKGGHRAISLDDNVWAALRGHKARQSERLLGYGVTGCEWVFTHDARDPWRGDYMTLAFGRIRNELGLPHVHLHSLRHFSATQLIGAGVDIVTVSHRLGHSRPSTTLDFYAAHMPARDNAAADIMGRLLG